jgi:hypothetical protein
MLHWQGNMLPMLEVYRGGSEGTGQSITRYAATIGLWHVLKGNAAETDDFGYKHLLWVYSGRRGIHLWISDKEAMDLTDDERRAIVHYIEVVKV